MNDFKLNLLDETSSHFDIDISFEKVQSFAQRVLLTLNTWSDEFAYNTKKGIDYKAVLKSSFSPQSLEAFFLFSLKKQLSDFDTLDSFEAEYNQIEATVKVSFIAYSKTGENTSIDNFEL